jgi:lysophospholipase L1-like esterase
LLRDKLLHCYLLSLCLLSGCQVFHAPSRVAFLGDSITQGWSYPEANFGRFGNTTAQMLERLTPLTSGRRYAQVVILGGTNDILLRIPQQVTLRNLRIMATQVERAGAEPILCEIPPIFHSFNVTDKTDYGGDVQHLNAGIAALAAQHHWRMIDFYDPLRLHPGFSSDGVHMKRSGYWVMEFALLRKVPNI